MRQSTSGRVDFVIVFFFSGSLCLYSMCWCAWCFGVFWGLGGRGVSMMVMYACMFLVINHRDICACNGCVIKTRELWAIHVLYIHVLFVDSRGANGGFGRREMRINDDWLHDKTIMSVYRYREWRHEGSLGTLYKRWPTWSDYARKKPALQHWTHFLNYAVVSLGMMSISKLKMSAWMKLRRALGPIDKWMRPYGFSFRAHAKTAAVKAHCVTPCYAVVALAHVYCVLGLILYNDYNTMVVIFSNRCSRSHNRYLNIDHLFANVDHRQTSSDHLRNDALSTVGGVTDEDRPQNANRTRSRVLVDGRKQLYNRASKRSTMHGRCCCET